MATRSELPGDLSAIRRSEEKLCRTGTGEVWSGCVLGDEFSLRVGVSRKSACMSMCLEEADCVRVCVQFCERVGVSRQSASVLECRASLRSCWSVEAVCECVCVLGKCMRVSCEAQVNSLEYTEVRFTACRRRAKEKPSLSLGQSSGHGLSACSASKHDDVESCEVVELRLLVALESCGVAVLMIPTEVRSCGLL